MLTLISYHIISYHIISWYVIWKCLWFTNTHNKDVEFAIAWNPCAFHSISLPLSFAQLHSSPTNKKTYLISFLPKNHGGWHPFCSPNSGQNRGNRSHQLSGHPVPPVHQASPTASRLFDGPKGWPQVLGWEPSGLNWRSPKDIVS